MPDRYELRRWFLWWPVGLAVGGAAYFLLPFEPSGAKVACGVALASLIALGAQKAEKYALRSASMGQKTHDFCLFSLLLLRLLLAAALGFGAAKVRTVMVQPPMLAGVAERVMLTGFVESVEDVPRGSFDRPRTVRRLILSHLEGLPFQTPKNLKVRVQGPEPKLRTVRVFQTVQLVADVFPAPYPLTAHGYDAPFDIFFKGLSGLGRVHALKEIVTPARPPRGCRGRLAAFRAKVTQRIHEQVSPIYAPLASALITGDKSGLTVRMREQFTRAGISHLLAISGLHMGLLTALVFALFSRLLVLIPGLALHISVRKIAACITMPLTLFYLLLSGSSFSAMRSFIMVSFSMIAVLLDQRAISLRCTAMAATVILLLFPESVFSISFQLSFASVTGLCYFYETQCDHRARRKREKCAEGRAARLIRRCGSLFFQSMSATFVATIVTAPLTVYCFQRFTLVGILGNLFAVPLLSFFVLPMGVFASFSLVFAQKTPFLFATWEHGIRAIAWVAERVAALPGADCWFAKPRPESVVGIVLAALWLIIWQGRKRWLGAPVLLLALALFMQPDRPEIFATHAGDVIGLADYTKGVFRVSNPRLGSFPAKVWSQEVGLTQVDLMGFDQRDALHAQLPLGNIHEEDVLIGLRTQKAAFQYKNVCFHTKKRPWYARSSN